MSDVFNESIPLRMERIPSELAALFLHGCHSLLHIQHRWEQKRSLPVKDVGSVTLASSIGTVDGSTAFDGICDLDFQGGDFELFLDYALQARRVVVLELQGSSRQWTPRSKSEELADRLVGAGFQVSFSTLTLNQIYVPGDVDSNDILSDKLMIAWRY